MIISLSGAPGSGKSTVAKKLAEELGWERYYMGGLRREKAKQRGLTLAEYNQLGETDPETDKEVDQYQRELGKKKDNFIIEGRTSWYFIPHSFKIYIDVEAQEGAKRIFKSLKAKDNRNEDKDLNNWESVLQSNQERVASDSRRYQKYYNIDICDLKNYDFYLDTSKLTIEEVFLAVYQRIKDELDKRKK